MNPFGEEERWRRRSFSWRVVVRGVCCHFDCLVRSLVLLHENHYLYSGVYLVAPTCCYHHCHR